jgi:TrmH family RNA methyltransferase
VRDLGSEKRLKLAIHEHVRFVLVRPHYPENFGASARALKAMGFSELVLVQPSRLCSAEHEMAFKMAVKSWDVLENARVVRTLEAALEGASEVVATTARRGVSGVKTPRELAPLTVAEAAAGRHTAILFGNEKTGLSEAEHAAATAFLRIPMAADQPSINLAQAVQLVAYELFTAALYARGRAEE